MKVLACDVEWLVSGSSVSCPGTLQNIDADNIPSGMTLEDAQILQTHALELFAVIAAFLILRKAVQ